MYTGHIQQAVIFYSKWGERHEEARNQMEEHSIKKTSKKVILFGGHPNWRKKFLERNPSVRMIDYTKLLKLDSLIRNADKILINSEHISHKQYYAVRNVVKRANVPLQYVT